ncbi:MAG: helix-turn-helix domain-containing protein [Candidatus Tyrphobacter sp.]
MERPGGRGGDAVGRSSEAPADLRVPALTQAQRHVLRYALEGYSVRRIAQVLSCSEKTVGAHLTGIFRAVGVGNRYELLVKLNASALRALQK